MSTYYVTPFDRLSVVITQPNLSQRDIAAHAFAVTATVGPRTAAPPRRRSKQNPSTDCDCKVPHEYINASHWTAAVDNKLREFHQLKVIERQMPASDFRTLQVNAALYNHSISVRPSVCLSVCHTLALRSATERIKVRSRNIHHRIVSVLGEVRWFIWKFGQNHSERCHQIRVGYGNCQFWHLSRRTARKAPESLHLLSTGHIWYKTAYRFSIGVITDDLDDLERQLSARQVFLIAEKHRCHLKTLDNYC